MSVEFRVISIGTLSHNPLWGESAAVRTGHATTTLVRDGDRSILVDPSLPATALAARFFERTGRGLGDVTDVFCTSLRPMHRRSIEAFPDAGWWAPPQELEAYGQHLDALLDSAGRLDVEEAKLVEKDIDLIRRIKPASDKLSGQVHLYPLPGPSAGSAGLLLTPPTKTILIAGDAAITAEHVAAGQVWAGCSDREAAMESLQDALEVADVIIPGHDNVMLAPRAWF